MYICIVINDICIVSQKRDLGITIEVMTGSLETVVWISWFGQKEGKIPANKSMVL